MSREPAILAGLDDRVDAEHERQRGQQGARHVDAAERAQEGLGDELSAALSDDERATVRSLLSRVGV